MVIVWTIVLIAALIVEGATFALVAIWFAAGALGALIAAGLGAPFIVQLIIFVSLAAVMLIFTRPFLKKLLPNKFIPTNSELEVGRTAVVIEAVDNATGKGRVKLGGVNWAAISENDEDIPVDEVVVVKEIRSAKVVVARSGESIEKKN